LQFSPHYLPTLSKYKIFIYLTLNNDKNKVY
jgi:hypothetical protein